MSAARNMTMMGTRREGRMMTLIFLLRAASSNFGGGALPQIPSADAPLTMNMSAPTTSASAPKPGLMISASSPITPDDHA